MKRFIAYIILSLSFLMGINAYSQYSEEQTFKIDSLKSVIENAKHDTIKLKVLIDLSAIVYIANPDTDIFICKSAVQLARENLKNNDLSEREIKAYRTHLASAVNNLGYQYFNKGKLDSAILYFEESLQASKDLGSKVGEATALNNLGYLISSKGDSEKGLEYYKKSLKIREEVGDKKLIANSLNNLGIIYNNKGDIKRALEYFFKSLKIEEEENNKPGIALGLNNIATIYDDSHEWEKSLEYHNKSLAIRREIGDKQGEAVSLGNIAYIYQLQNRTLKSLDYHKKSLKLYQEIEYPEGIARANQNIGEIYKDLDSLDLALTYFEKAVETSSKIDNKKVMSAAFTGLSSVQFELGKVSLSINNGKKGLQISEEIGFPKQIKNAAFNLYNIYKSTNKSDDALKMHELFVTMKDSIFNTENEKESVKLGMQYEFDKQEALNKIQHEKEIAVQEERRRKQSIISNLSIASASIFVILLLIIYRRLKITRKQKAIIEEQSVELKEINEELNQQNEEIASQRDEIEQQNQKLALKNKEIDESIRAAERIQNAFFSFEDKEARNIPEHFILFKPLDIVSGDFYWMHKDGDLVYLAVVDCTGHGVPGAFLSLLGASLLNEIVINKQASKPSQILDLLREKIIIELNQKDVEDSSKEGMDISLICLDTSTKNLDFAGAINPLYIIRNNSEDVEIIKGHREPIGFTLNSSPFENHSIKLNQGDQLYLFSDGFADQFGGTNNKKYGYKRFRNTLSKISNKSLDQQKSHLESEFENWITEGNEVQIDDVCVIGVRL